MPQVESVFRILADKNRTRMVKLLGENELTVGELERSLGLSQSATSQHLKLLNDAGLVVCRKHGNFRIYSLRKEALQKAMRYFDSLWDEGLNKMKTKLEHGKG
ncbi:metalloregulator ArsR/SmtB family transcription factor [Fulvivirgaceae bacterium BMA10]|uniref:Metalloregulator ArsR/SmtB family transcription factor n=1 Tax=Splendidivirga corallicola TaxID=3051826 RepID=A0ABT8KMG4_9BACT|nr:metalloregulator ArsR/SmtB family transcription factor [Fulvivirgaceae bacterium BMA10]